MVERECMVCNNLFYAERKTKQYCSDSCKQEAYRVRKEEKEIGGIVTTEEFKVEVKPIEKSTNTTIELYKDPELDHATKMPLKTARQIRANGTFLRMIYRLEKVNQTKVKLEIFYDLINGFVTLRNWYIKTDEVEFAQYPFLEDLERMIAEFQELERKIDQEKNKILLSFDGVFFESICLLIHRLEKFNKSMRNRYA